MLLQVGGFQGCSRDKQRDNWRCARTVRERPHCQIPPPSHVSVPTMPFIRTHGFHECICNRQGLSFGTVSRFIISAHFFIAWPPPTLALETLSLLGMAEKLGCSGWGQITASAHSRHLTANPLPLGIIFCRPLQGIPFLSIDIGGPPCAVPALCPRCAKSPLFSTTGSHGSQGPEFLTLQPPLLHQGLFYLV